MAKILLVEDDKSLREIYGVRLMAEGYEIVSAGDGEEALAMAIKERPDLIVSDVMMPKISGFDMLDILRSTSETKDVKVIMMTALSSDDQRARGESLGADRYLVKSQVGIEDVVRTVHDVLGDSIASAPVAPAQPVQGPAPFVPHPVPVAPPVITAPVPEPFVPAPAPAPAPIAPLPEPAPVAPAPIVVPLPEPVAPIIPEAPAYTAPEPFVPPTPEPFPAPVAPATLTELPSAPVPLPQPTAPFSSPAPASLGERVIEPLTTPVASPTGDIASQIEQELSGAATPGAPTPPLPPAV
jgi:CheY-like chemotaxis protein